MKNFDEIKNDPKIKDLILGFDGGKCNIKLGHMRYAFIVFSNGLGWDHVSVSLSKECPTWEEMCKIKDVFFKEDECVIQYHPPKKNYVNTHNYCLHMWRPQFTDIPMPPTFMV